MSDRDRDQPENPPDDDPRAAGGVEPRFGEPAGGAVDDHGPPAPSRQRFKDDASLGWLALVGGVLILAVIGLIMIPNLNVSRSGHSPGRAREKACYANMRILLSAIEMYNMDHATMIYFNHQPAPVGMLVQQQYLKTPVVCPEGAGGPYIMLSKNLPPPVPLATDGLDVDVLAEAPPPPSDPINGSPGTGSPDPDGVPWCPVHGTVD